MAYDEGLAQRLREILGGRPEGIDEDEPLRYWVEACRRFVTAMPPK